jgi:DNA-binding protein H-NS
MTFQDPKSPQDLKSMSAEELWSLHKMVASVLARKIAAEKQQLDRRLQKLGVAQSAPAKKISYARRPYPQVIPKFRNPAEPCETWAGRGKQPRWLAAQLKSGKKLDDFRIQSVSDRARSGRVLHSPIAKAATPKSTALALE